jgi:MazG family protein
MSNLPPSVPQGNWEGILELARILRGPQGCPWDAAQGLEALAGHLVEEAYEVLHAARTGTPLELDGEIGDVCFLVALVLAAHKERGGSEFPQIASSVIAKIVRRHPHVFAPPEKRPDPRTAALRWEEIKREERRAAGGDAESGEPGLGPPAPALPALLQALRLQQRAAGYGFDWPSVEPVFSKVEEEIDELRQARKLRPKQARTKAAEEAGDLLFAVVNLVRQLGLDPEGVLREANRKFRTRFNLMVALASRDGSALETLPLARMDDYWEQAKRETSPSQDAGTESDPPPGRNSQDQ